ncbi:hypothetical protein RI367_006748 [Sorochytrium milnesiophthora]
MDYDVLTVKVPGRDYRPHYNVLLDAHVRMHWTPVYILALVWALHYLARYALVIRARKLTPGALPVDVLNVSVSDGTPGRHAQYRTIISDGAAVVPGTEQHQHHQHTQYGQDPESVRGRLGRGVMGVSPTVHVTPPAGDNTQDGALEDDLDTTTPLLTPTATTGGGLAAIRGTALEEILDAIPRVKNAANIAFNMTLFMFASTVISTLAVYRLPKPVLGGDGRAPGRHSRHGNSDNGFLFGSSQERTLLMLVLNWMFMGITVVWAVCEQVLPGPREVQMVRRVSSIVLFILLLSNGIAMATENAHRTAAY